MEGTYRERGRLQPVGWLAFGDEAFARARALDRPALVVSGTTWSARCAELDREAFQDEQIAALVNDRFVPVRIDRDEQPDLDRRCQRAVGAIAGERGWPLVAFLTPDGRAFFGGTYYPKDPAPDRPSFRGVLDSVSATWTERRAEVDEAARALERELSRPRPTRRLDAAFIADGLRSISNLYDAEHGGFLGPHGKRPWPGALELLLAAARRDGSRERLAMVEHTLASMARGAICDQLGGGFFHRTHDALWLSPSFEKLLCDNVELLRVYLLAHETTGASLFRDVAASIADYIVRELCETARGGFYASQAADAAYYGWTATEVMRAVPIECVKAIGHHFHFRPEASNVPYRALDAATIAAQYSSEPMDVIDRRIRTGIDALWLARERRPPPYTDRRIFASWNLRACEAFELAAHVLGRPECAEIAALTRARLAAESGGDADAFAVFDEAPALGGTSLQAGFTGRSDQALAVFDEEEDLFGPSRLALTIDRHTEAPIERPGPEHGSLLVALFRTFGG